MPVEVPKESKNYTTVYDNFKGVDFTNDASNIYRRRSPSGVNMLPGLDGAPSKRTGWEVKVTVEDYAKACGVEDYDPEVAYEVGDYAIYEDVAYVCTEEITEPEEWDETHWAKLVIEPGRMHHFTYDGFDFLMIFNSLGVFWIKGTNGTLTLAQGASGTEASPVPVEFPPTVEREGQRVKLSADQNRAFFFEGGGNAGFYVFVENSLYRFGAADNGEMYFWYVEPKVPVVLIGATPSTGIGTINKPVNMLTEKRAVQFFGDGTSDYRLPSTPDSDEGVFVEVIDNDTGDWREETNWTLDTNVVKFQTGHIPPASTVDNVRISYTPDDEASYTLDLNAESSRVSTFVELIQYYYRLRKVTKTYQYDKKKKKYVLKSTKYGAAGKWIFYDEVGLGGHAKIDVPSVYNRASLSVYSNITGPFNPFSCTKSWYPYGDSVALTFDEFSLAKTYGSKKTTTGAWGGVIYGSSTYSETIAPPEKTVVTWQEQRRTDRYTKNFKVYGTYTKVVPSFSDAGSQKSREAFMECRKSLTFGNNIYNQAFISASTMKAFRNRVWYCAANDPSYFPDTNYIEVGADDKAIMGLIQIGSYLGIVKMGSGTQASVYLAYATSFEEETTYAVKQSVSGIGAISTGAFNILNEEPLFLSNNGVVGVDISESDTNKQIRSRSHFINKALLNESDLSSAISYVHNGLYYLGIGTRCYVLDGAQKSSWANEKTNLQYECYYLENVPAQCFGGMDGDLYFTDYNGALCRFKNKGEPNAYVDDYSVAEAQWVSIDPPENDEFDFSSMSGASDDYAHLVNSYGDYLCVYPDKTKEYNALSTYNIGDYTQHEGDIYVCIEAVLEPEEWNASHWELQEPTRLMVMAGEPDVNETVYYYGDYYTITDVYTDQAGVEKAVVSSGVPICAEWSTIADDDEMVHFFKNLRKKGCVVSLLPGEGSHVRVLIRADEKDPADLGYFEAGVTELPADLIVKKKIKKYKRLQFIIRNDWYDDGFALDQIIKTYTVGNYSKNRK